MCRERCVPWVSRDSAGSKSTICTIRSSQAVVSRPTAGKLFSCDYCIAGKRRDRLECTARHVLTPLPRTLHGTRQTLTLHQSAHAACRQRTEHAHGTVRPRRIFRRHRGIDMRIAGCYQLCRLFGDWCVFHSATEVKARPCVAMSPFEVACSGHRKAEGYRTRTPSPATGWRPPR